MVELFVDVSCPFSLLAARRARAALAEVLPGSELRLRICPLSPPGEAKGRAATEVLLERLEMASLLRGGDNFETGALALRSGSLEPIRSVAPYSALKWAEAVGGERAAYRLFIEVGSRFLEHGQEVGSPKALAELALEIGLPHERLLRALTNDHYRAAVERDRRAARRLGLRLVPVLAIADGTLVEGLVAMDEYRERLHEAKRKTVLQ